MKEPGDLLPPSGGRTLEPLLQVLRRERRHKSHPLAPQQNGAAGRARNQRQKAAFPAVQYMG